MPPPRLSFKLYEVVFEGNALNEDCALLTTKYSSALAAGVKLPCNPLAEILLKVNPVGCADGTTHGRIPEVVVNVPNKGFAWLYKGPLTQKRFWAKTKT
jgi:hypothetical protein